MQTINLEIIALVWKNPVTCLSSQNSPLSARNVRKLLQKWNAPPVRTTSVTSALKWWACENILTILYIQEIAWMSFGFNPQWYTNISKSVLIVDNVFEHLNKTRGALWEIVTEGVCWVTYHSCIQTVLWMGTPSVIGVSNCEIWALWFTHVSWLRETPQQLTKIKVLWWFLRDHGEGGP